MKKKGVFVLTLFVMILFVTNVFADSVDSASNYFVFDENVNITKEVFGDDFEQMTANENMITVEIYVETFWSTDTLAKSYKYDTFSFFKKIKNKDELKNYDTVKIICNAAGTDKYGNDIKILALSSTYSTDDIANINFENMTAERLYDNFDQAKFIHPAMNS